MDRLFFYILLLGSASSIALLLFPKISYTIKGVLVSLAGGFWIYISINFLAWNFIYIAKDKHGVFFLLSVLHGIWISISAMGFIMTFFIEKKKSCNRNN
ncbi:MAG: hypothetical protein Tsb0014_23530 [Pleurocapsa sp.]